MSERPRRIARQRVVEKQKLDLSDLSDEEIDDGDVSSGSSDEYNPENSVENPQKRKESSEEESEDEIESSQDDSPIKASSSNRNRSRKSQSFVATLRKQAVNKYSNKLNSSNQRIQDVLKKAQYKKTSALSQSSDSENEGKQAPVFDCSGGLRLSDNSNDESSDDESSNKKVNDKKKPNVINSINEQSKKPMVDLKSIHDNLQRMKSAKEKLSKYQQAEISAENNDINVANLLEMGENSKKSSQKRKKAQEAEDSDSDNWEEVEDDENAAYKGPKGDVEILLNDFGDDNRKKVAKPVDIEAQLKRKFNKKRKEFQEHLHKTELMCWVTHCNFVNEKLNNPSMMQQALKMLPQTKNKSQCYPKDKTDLDYFTQITKWFKQTVTLRNSEMYCKLEKRPPLTISLALQMKYKAAICRRDYVLIFIILLRAIGVQCRMVQSLEMDPKICPKSDLMSLSKKEEAVASKSVNKSAKQSSRKSKKSSKSNKSSGKLKLDQLDGADEAKAAANKPKKQIKIRGSSVYNDDESYIDLNNFDKNLASTPIKAATNPPPNVKLALTASNQNKFSLADKLKKNIPVNKVLSPRKTRSKSRDERPKPVENVAKEPESTKATNKAVETVKKTLKVFSPRRLRSRSKSTDVKQTAKVGEQKVVPETKKPNLKVLAKKPAAKDTEKAATKPSNSEKSAPEQKKPISESKKPNLKALPTKLGTIAEKPAAVAEKPVPIASKGAKPKDSLKVFSPMRLRSRSRSTDINPDSKKRELNSKNDENVNKKKSKVTETAKASRKRPAKDENLVKTKKSKKQDDEAEMSDDSLKYFRNVSTTSNVKVQKQVKQGKSPMLLEKIDRRILSSDDEAAEATMQSSSPKKSKGIDIWVEVYSEKDEKWLSIDILRGKVDCVKDICQKATRPLVYVFAWNNDKTVKDVSARYCTNLNTTVRKMRVDREYLLPILKIFNTNYVRTSRDRKEDDELNQVQFDMPKPTSIAEFKNHPLYVLKRHLLKFQAIYPPEPPILGYIRDEAIYPRDCCFNLHSRETWLKEARVVKLNEKPYKNVTTLRWDRVNNKMLKDIPLELFGIWQTKDFEPPVAENGLVPRNAYGNVELFKKCMLPIGTVHIQLPGLNKVCKKLGIDCSTAIIGFDSNGGWPYPVYDGFVVCKEFEQKVIDAWARDQEEAEKKEIEKYEKRVYGNWKKLIKGLLIRERLNRKYNNFQNNN